MVDNLFFKEWIIFMANLRQNLIWKPTNLNSLKQNGKNKFQNIAHTLIWYLFESILLHNYLMKLSFNKTKEYFTFKIKKKKIPTLFTWNIVVKFKNPLLNFDHWFYQKEKWKRIMASTQRSNGQELRQFKVT